MLSLSYVYIQPKRNYYKFRTILGITDIKMLAIMQTYSLLFLRWPWLTFAFHTLCYMDRQRGMLHVYNEILFSHAKESYSDRY